MNLVQMKKLVFIFLLYPALTMGQSQERERIQQMEEKKEMQRQREIKFQLDSAVTLMEQENYEAADVKFRYVLRNVRGVPTDLAYYFGKNSFHLKKYKQSIDWLNKYIQLKGTSGQFSEQAVILLRQAEQAHLNESQMNTQQAAEVLSRDYDIDCGPTGKVTCPVCAGSTVIVRKTYLGETYKTCQYCNKTGILSCEDYNKLVRGELKPAGN